MKMFKAADVTRNSGDVFAAAAAEPVAITKHSKPRFVVMSIERFNMLSAKSDTRETYALDELPADLTQDLTRKLEGDQVN